MSLTLTNIPTIMRHQGWLNAARLMEIWFSRPSAVAPMYGTPETATIRMDRWVLTFPRARHVYDQLVNNRMWTTPNARREIAKVLSRKGWLATPFTIAFNELANPLEELDANSDYIQQLTVDYDFMDVPDLDDMGAALGRFSMRVLVAGSVAPSSRGDGHEVTIEEVGIYVRDSYDFEGYQPLGYWDDVNNTVSKTPDLGGYEVWNRNFRDWRAQTGYGGDFLVYSDLKRISLASPDTFVV